MPQKTNKTIIYFSIIIIAIASIFWVNGLILAWSPPSASPPSGNISPPINTGSSSQTKSGSLISNTDIRAPIFYDQNNTGYYVDPASTSRLNYGVYDNLYSYGWMQSPIFYDSNNTGYYVDPASTSRLNTITPNSISLGGVSRTTWPESQSCRMCLQCYGENWTTSWVCTGYGGGTSPWTYSPFNGWGHNCDSIRLKMECN